MNIPADSLIENQLLGLMDDISETDFSDSPNYKNGMMDVLGYLTSRGEMSLGELLRLETPRRRSCEGCGDQVEEELADEGDLCGACLTTLEEM